jgi:phenylacetate-CoA ligase
MEVVIESRGGSDAAELGTLLRHRLGIEVEVTLCQPGGTSGETQVDTRQKPIRLIDERKL